MSLHESVTNIKIVINYLIRPSANERKGKNEFVKKSQEKLKTFKLFSSAQAC